MMMIMIMMRMMMRIMMSIISMMMMTKIKTPYTNRLALIYNQTNQTNPLSSRGNKTLRKQQQTFSNNTI